MIVVIGVRDVKIGRRPTCNLYIRGHHGQSRVERGLQHRALFLSLHLPTTNNHRLDQLTASLCASGLSAGQVCLSQCDVLRRCIE